MAAKKKQVSSADRGECALYKVRRKLHHDGGEYSRGETVELFADDAAPLLASGVVVLVKTAETAKKETAPAS